MTDDLQQRLTALCTVCGEPMPPGEEMFKFHGFSCDCPKPPMALPPAVALTDEELDNIRYGSTSQPIAAYARQIWATVDALRERLTEAESALAQSVAREAVLVGAAKRVTENCEKHDFWTDADKALLAAINAAPQAAALLAELDAAVVERDQLRSVRVDDIATFERLTAELAEAKAMRRTEGTVEVCELCRNEPRENRCYSSALRGSRGFDTWHPSCPIRAAQETK